MLPETDGGTYDRTAIHSREVKLKSVEGKLTSAGTRIDRGRVRVATWLEAAKPTVINPRKQSQAECEDGAQTDQGRIL